MQQGKKPGFFPGQSVCLLPEKPGFLFCPIHRLQNLSQVLETLASIFIYKSLTSIELKQ
ncbi:Uncharacterized protein dnm_041680 [Desulfonema magnum]|uniref:Uncharacterized protein n=1 Tax=Desulfonema magnum TaxID=45655 RepID=A0A975BMX4_9BACT|nr:Uncharacterized protein dnm_041680 [Desulfonema magnum]